MHLFILNEPTVFKSSNICSYLQSLSNWESLHIVMQIFSIWYNLIIPSSFGGWGYPGLVAMGTHWVEDRGSHFVVKKKWGSIAGSSPGIPPITLFCPSSAVSDLERCLSKSIKKTTESETLASVKSPSMTRKDVTMMQLLQGHSWTHNNPSPTPCKPNSLTGLSIWVSLELLLWSLCPTWDEET